MSNITEGNQFDEHLLVEGCVSGDMKSLEILIQRYRKMVFNIAYKVTFNYAEAEDLTQDILLKIISNIKDFRGESKLKTWMYSVATNHCINYEKKAKAITVDLDGYYQSRSGDLSHALAPVEKKLLNKELIESVHQAVNSLPDRLKGVVILHEFDGLSCREVSQECGKPMLPGHKCDID